MALAKFSGLRLGSGSLSDKNIDSEVTVSNRSPYDGTVATTKWSSTSTYLLDAAVLYKGVSYNSLQTNNIGHQPDSSPSWWSPVDGKDGDIWIKTPAAGFPSGGSDVEMYLKVNKVWKGITGTPFVVTLNDNQSTPAIAMEYPSSAYRFAKIEYTVKRGSGDGSKRKGIFEILHDGSSPSPVYSHEFLDIGNDTGVVFTLGYNSGKIQLSYTSNNLGLAIEFKYTIKGWN